MKLAFITEMYAPSIGGLESRIKGWAEELVLQGHQIEVFCIGHAAKLASVESINGVTVRRLVADPAYMTGGLGRRSWATVFRFCWALWRSSPQLASFDAIVFGKWPLLPALVVPLPRQPVVAFDWCEFRSGRIWGLVYRLLAAKRRFRHVAIHGGIAQWLRGQGVSSAKISTVGSSGPPVEAVRPEDKANRNILFMGRLSEHKQPMLLMHAFAAGRLGEKGYTLHFAGGGPQADVLTELAQQVPGVVIHGRISEQTKLQLLRSCTLLALPSLREGFPVVVAEACAFGTPTLTIEAADNGTAYVVPQLDCGWVVPGTAEALALAMETYADRLGQGWAECHSNALKRSADTLSIEAQARALVGCLAAH